MASSVNKSLSSYESSKREQQAEVLFASLGEGTISTDEFGRITRVNPVARQLLGYTEAELIGAWFPKIISALSLEETPMTLIDRPITKAFLSGKPVSDKLYYLHKNGQPIPVAVTAAPILLNGRPLGAIEVIRDITLEQEVDRMKSEFISLASHQLRTPLSAIKTYSHMLSDRMMGELNADQAKALDTIIGATDRMNELISMLLNITRIESGTISVSSEKLDVYTILQQVTTEMSLMAQRKNVSIKLKTKAKGNGNITSDALIIKEAVTNLVSNAIKYTPAEGWVEITLKPRPRDVLIVVSDSGWGIPLYSQDQIFSKFFRAHNIVKRETTGTGLGLYLVKGLLDALDGKVWFDSQEGEGTTFYITLPRRPSRARKAKEA